MIKSKIVETLRTLSPNEFKSFGRFVDSPYFNSSKSAAGLYEYMKKYYPDFNNKKFTLDNSYRFLFPGRKYNGGTLRKLFSDLQSLAEEFMILEGLKTKNPFGKKIVLLEQLTRRNLDKLFMLKYSELEKSFGDEEKFEDDYFKNNFELAVTHLNFNLGRGRSGFNSIQVLNELQECANYIISFVLIISFKLNQDISVINMETDSDEKNTLVYKFLQSLGPESFLEYFKKYAPEFYPVIAIYYNRYMISSGFDKDDKYYRELKNLVQKNIGSFTRFEKYNLMLFLENSCDEKIYANKNFNPELHEIHKMMLDTGLYKSKDTNFFGLTRFRSMIRTALFIKEFNWAENFINKYGGELPKEFQVNMKYYSHALLNFGKGKYGEALANMSKVKSEVYVFKFDVWVMRLQCLFELKYYEEAGYSYDSLKHSLKADTTSPKLMTNRFSNFLHYYNFLLKAAFDKGQDSGKYIPVGKIINEMRNSSEILEKGWLIKKFEEI